MESIGQSGYSASMTAIFLKSIVDPAEAPKNEKPQIALLGRSNVGKSSLINHLANAKNLARAGATPGVTRTVNIYEFDSRYLLADMPGYGFSAAKRSEGMGFASIIGDYLSKAERLRMVFVIIDARRGVMDADRYAISQLVQQSLPYSIVCNKTDKLKRAELAEVLKAISQEFPGITTVTHSTEEKSGLGALRDLIEKTVRAK